MAKGNYTTVITKNGQITIPKEFREKLGLEEGFILTVEEKDGGLVLRTPIWIDELAGSGKGTVEEIKKELDRLRGES